MAPFTCVRCHSALATYTVPIDADHTEPWCDSCFGIYVTDYMLDLVNNGELRVVGRSFETTERFEARRTYEEGE